MIFNNNQKIAVIENKKKRCCTREQNIKSLIWFTLHNVDIKL